MRRGVVLMKMKVLIVFGGVSSEHDVSLVSARSVNNNIPADKYDVLTMGITKEGVSYLYTGSPDNLPEGKWLETPEYLERCVISPDREHHGIIHIGSGETERVDVVFPVLHGKNGEDGTMQGLLEISGIPFVGCKTAASAVCMDKSLTNALLDYHKVSQAKWVAVNKFDFTGEKEKFAREAADYLGFPIFVKPANAGSSVGIRKASDIESLVDACDYAFEFDKKIVLEENITGAEVECAVLGNDEPIASTVGEIVPCNDFYDYDAKYIANATGLYIPARLPDEKIEEIRQKAVRIYKLLGCSGLTRVDFFVRESDGEVMLNELNTIPGFTSISMYPKLFAASGIEYPELIDRLIRYALEN